MSLEGISKTIWLRHACRPCRLMAVAIAFLGATMSRLGVPLESAR
jgi:hypothetical protein